MSMARDYTHPFQLYDVHDTIPCKGKIVSMVGPVRSFKRKSANITSQHCYSELSRKRYSHDSYWV